MSSSPTEDLGEFLLESFCLSKDFFTGGPKSNAEKLRKLWVEVVAADESKDPKWKKVISGAGFAIINTPGILLAAIRAGVLTVAAADEIKTKLEQRRFKMKFDSFASLN